MSRRKSLRLGRKEYFPSIRLVFSYEGTEVLLVSKQHVEVISAPTDALEPREEESGFWVELKDEDGLTLYRRVMQNPIKFAYEVRTDDRERPLRWYEIENPRGLFVVLVPEYADAKEIVLFSSPRETRAQFEAAKEIARFDIRKDAGEVAV